MIKLNDNPKDGDLRIWHIPQIPMRPFKVDVSSIQEASVILRILAEYDEFEYNNNVKGDYSNSSGLMIYNEGEDDWLDWEDESYNNIDYYIYGDGQNEFVN